MTETKGIPSELVNCRINKIGSVFFSPRSIFEVTKLLFPETSLDAN